jgi:hypothetical protein
MVPNTLKEIVSPLAASAMVWRKEPTPPSFKVETVFIVAALAKKRDDASASNDMLDAANRQ